MRRIQKELKKTIRECKDSYRKMEEQLQQNNVREVWKGLKTMSGHNKGRGKEPAQGNREWADKLNLFFNRFDSASSPPSSPLLSLPPPSSPPPLLPHLSPLSSHPPLSPPPPHLNLTLTADQMRGQLKRICIRKAAGPDGISPRLLKDCLKTALTSCVGCWHTSST